MPRKSARKSDIVRLNLRLTRDLYDRLVKSTHKHGTSLQTEVITRIEKTFGNEVVPQHLIDALRKTIEKILAEHGVIEPVKVEVAEGARYEVRDGKLVEVGRAPRPTTP
jgi:hypothetical protein